MGHLRSPRSLAVALAALLAPSPSVSAHGAASLPDHFESLELAGVFRAPVGLAFAADGTLFVAEKRGKVRVHDGTAIQATDFVDLRDEVNLTGDRGLLGLALHPGFVPDGGPTSWVYLLYTVTPVLGEDPVWNDDQKHSFGRLTRYRAITVGTEIVADEATRHVLLGNQLPDGTVPDGIPNVHASHANGTLVFGADGSLIVTCGDGAHFDQADKGGLDPAAFETFTHPDTGLKGPMPADQDCGAFRAQDLRSLGGKVLRLDPETGFGYPSNPFWDGDPASHASRVWALGLRNPYRATLIPGTGVSDAAAGEPGTLLIGEVGWEDWEELNRCVGGENFGWPCFEGPFPDPGYEGFEYSPNPMGYPDCSNLGPGVLTGALVSWDHSDAGALIPSGVHVDEDGVPQGGFSGSCVTGGAVYEGGDYPPEYAGRLFFGDFADDWIRTAVIDPVLGVTEIADFAFDADLVVDFEAHPLTGEIHYAELGQAPDFGRVHRIRYGANLTPVALAAATPLFGDAPLTVDFDANGSSDPEEDPLTYEWDFGDGSPPASGAGVQHTYTAEGLYTATVTVTDDGDLSDSDEVQIAVGNVPPTARILAPLPGVTFDAPDALDLAGTGTDFIGESLTFEWTVDLYHDTHIHPAFATLPGQTAVLAVDPHGGVDELHYLRIELTVRNETGLEGRDHLFVYPVQNLVDPTGTSHPIARVQELTPPYPIGSGNPDIEVVRDGDQPPVGNGNRQRQFDTYHAGDQGDDDWIGFELGYAPVDTVRFTSLLFQEGMHFAPGGWFEDFTVEVRDQGAWTPVSNLKVLPGYPFSVADVPGFDGINYQTYEVQFDPQYGDAVRLRGNPGGASQFISAGELRARIITPIEPHPPWRDLTEGGVIVSKLQELVPPVPLGEGNLDPEVVRNGTYPAVGSGSKFAQVDTFHNGDQAGEDWVGYAFADWHLFERVVYQEGYHYPNGGWFDTLSVEVREEAGGPWEPVTGLSVTPAVPADTSSFGTYETFELTFDRVAARQIRIVGDPGGSDDFTSVGELRVYGPAHDEEACGWQVYGEGLGGTNTLTLGSTTPPFLGSPAVVVAGGAPAASIGSLVFGLAPLSLPALGGTLLVDPTGGHFEPLLFDGDGAATLAAGLASNPAFVGETYYLQAVAFDPSVPGMLRFSNGLELSLCP